MSEPLDPPPDHASPVPPPAREPSATDALPPPPTLSTTGGPPRTALVGGGVGAAGGALTIVGFFLPWVTLVGVVLVGCRGPFQIATITLNAWYVALGDAGLYPALATVLILVAVLLSIILALRAFIKRPTLLRARLLIAAAVVALVDAGAQSYLWAINALHATSAPRVSSVFSSAFQAFGSGLWIIVSGMLAALAGGVILHGAARAPGRKLPLPETALAITTCLALVASGALASGIVTIPPLATAALACRNTEGAVPSAATQTLYVTIQDTLYALRPDDGAARWRCHDSLVDLQTAGPPTLANGIVYIAALDGTVFAVRADDGRLLWHRVIVPNNVYTLGTRSFGAPALVAADGALYGTDGNGGVFALRAADGALLWHNTSAGGNPARIVVSGGIVYGYGAPAYSPAYKKSGTQALFALDAHTGTWLWGADDLLWGSTQFAVAAGRTYDEELDSSPQRNLVYLVARDAADGTLRWRVPLFTLPPFKLLAPTLPFAVADGVVYAQTYAQTYTAFGGTEIDTPIMRALRAVDGQLLWSFTPNTAPQEGRTYWAWHCCAAVVDGVVYAAISSYSDPSYFADFYALSARDGSLAWHTRVSPNGLPTAQAIWTTPIAIVVTGGTLYAVAAGRHLVVALDARDGSPLWAHTLAVLRGTQTALPISPTEPPLLVSGDLVYFAADGLYALAASDGSVRWQLAPPKLSSLGLSPTCSPPALGP